MRMRLFNAVMWEHSEKMRVEEGAGVYRAQGAVSALTQLHNLIIDTAKEEEEE